MKTKHTPGPWTVNTVSALIDAPDGESLCLMRWPTTHRSEDETKANARLIAGSPSLYDFALNRAEQGDAEALNLLISLNLYDHAEDA